MSDGPWGADDSSDSTTLTNFEITQNDHIYSGNGYRVERNISLEATTSSYVSAYRAFTPRFKSVDLSDFDGFEPGKSDLINESDDWLFNSNLEYLEYITGPVKLIVILLTKKINVFQLFNSGGLAPWQNMALNKMAHHHYTS